jgi:glutamate racemase
MLVVACNSAVASAFGVAREAGREAGVEVLAVIEPEAEIAAAITENGRIGVLATPATVAGGAYKAALAHHGREFEVTEVAAPDLAPMIQAGSPFDERVVGRVRTYCEPLKKAGIDTLILGCTHYPVVAPMLQRMLGRDVRLVSAGHAIAAAAQRHLERAGIAAPGPGEGDYRFLCTGDPEEFREIGTHFLQMPLGEIERVPCLP